MQDLTDGYADLVPIVEQARTTVAGSCREVGARCGAALRSRRELPTARAMIASRQPVDLLHGLAHNPSASLALVDRLRAEGFSDVRAVRYGWRDDVPRVASAIADQVDGTDGDSRTGGARVHLVAHSLGGVAVRYWHDVLGGVDRTGAGDDDTRRVAAAV
jgi:triacylglycerol esterase/lipase EstA (alpha/beta hydrolase family)